MPPISPTDVTSPTTARVNDLQAIGQYTGVPQHVIIDGRDFLIVDADANGVAIFNIDSASGALSTPTYLTWPIVPSEYEAGDFDQYRFFTSPDGTKVTGFDGDSRGVAALTYNKTTSTWSVSYDPGGVAGGVTGNPMDFEAFQTTDGNVYGYGASPTDQVFTKYQWNWDTNSWSSTGTSFTSPIGSTADTTATRMVTGPDGSQYLVNFSSAGFPLIENTYIYQIDATTGNYVPGSAIRVPTSTAASGTGRLGALTRGEVSMDPYGNMVFSTTNGVQVINPHTGAFLYEDHPGGTDGTTFHYGSDLVYGENGYVYLIGRDGNQQLQTKVYQISSNGTWRFDSQGTDTSSGITWTGYLNGTYAESSNDVTTLSSGVKMIYTTQELTTGGPITQVAVQAANIGELPAPVCFVSGTLIETIQGLKPVEQLQTGDMVRTKDNGYKPILWIGSQTVALAGQPDKRFLPVRISAGALGSGFPETDLYVSQQHRILVRSRIVRNVIGTDEALVPAKKLLDAEGIDLVTDCDEVTYIHILFDQHEIVYSNGAETESFYAGPCALEAIGAEARAEVMALFPELADATYKAPSARIFPPGKLCNKLAMRHAKNKVALCGPH
ncbi:Hint domain-containing protein [uncultured Paracoccus sp.]|uniref:Hint domain-containing protein n=1 Tax=uncultured Paracoccus sp. TaxID=189685 RepID=UPI002615BCA7|nr:Hint domain-containing protein [uncultured Paracoccus sp.]